MAASGARLLVAAALLFPGVFSSPIYDASQRPIAAAEPDHTWPSVTPPLHVQPKQNRKLQGKFLHITGMFACLRPVALRGSARMRAARMGTSRRVWLDLAWCGVDISLPLALSPRGSARVG